MKTKKFNKKLSLKKSTIANLENNILQNIKGGAVTDATCFYTCGGDTCDFPCTFGCWTPNFGCYSDEYCPSGELAGC